MSSGSRRCSGCSARRWASRSRASLPIRTARAMCIRRPRAVWPSGAKSTNTPTFTDGYDHWALTQQGALHWTGSSIDPPTQRAAAAATTPRPAPAPTQAATRSDTSLQAFVGNVLADANAFWSRRLRTYQPARVAWYVSRKCGRRLRPSSNVGPFYCSGDGVVYLQTPFLEQLWPGRNELRRGRDPRPRDRPSRAADVGRSRCRGAESSRPGAQHPSGAGRRLPRRRLGSRCCSAGLATRRWRRAGTRDYLGSGGLSRHIAVGPARARHFRAAPAGLHRWFCRLQSAGMPRDLVCRLPVQEREAQRQPDGEHHEP